MIRPRGSVAALAPYSPPLEGRREAIRLDFNENTRGLPGGLGTLPDVVGHVYPEYGPFLGRLARYLDVDQENLMLSNGSGEALFVIAFAFIEPGDDRGLTSQPTFALIPHSLTLVGARLTQVDVTPDWTFDVASIEQALAEGVKVAVFASPDNPTGATLDPALVTDWCGRFPETLFVVDEAYAEYGGSSLLRQATKENNLLVVRTFSKAWGLAGLRLAAVVGAPELLAQLTKVRCPYSVNAAALWAADRLLPRSVEVREQARSVMARKARILDAVAERGYTTKGGEGNFFLLRAGREAVALVDFCRDRGVLLRDRSHQLPGAVRVTVGEEEEMEAFLACLDGFARARCLVFDLDDTLVDTSKSYDAVVAELVRRQAGSFDPGELAALRAGGGFNNDWDSTTEILRRRGVEADRQTVERDGKALYFAMGAELETLYLPEDQLQALSKRFRLFVYTGRPRDEYEPVWGARLDPLFERVLCADDAPHLPAKPAPDQLAALCTEAGVSGGYFVGNGVDDMAAACAAGLTPLAVATTVPPEALVAAGATTVLAKTGDVGKEFGQ